MYVQKLLHRVINLVVFKWAMLLEAGNIAGVLHIVSSLTDKRIKGMSLWEPQAGDLLLKEHKPEI